MPVLTPQERVGSVLDGKYRLDRILGEGGFGVVFAATHVGLGRPVAVKILHPNLADNGEMVGRFLREARATSALNHPNVIDVRDVVTSKENGVYMVLELLEGETLSALVERRPVLSLHETNQLLGPILDALAAAHAIGIVHRDVKPDNVFLARQPDGSIVPKLLDFGIAKLAEAGPAMATATGIVLGTPIYMAPEQAMGRSKEIGPPADVWSAAVMIYECLTGRYPFDLPPDPTPTSVVLEVVTGRIVPLAERRADLPPAVSAVLARALERELSRRLSSLAELKTTLEQAEKEMPAAPRAPAAAPIHLPPTLVATGPLAEPLTQKPGAQKPVAEFPPTMLATGEHAMKAPELLQRTGPIPGSPVTPPTLAGATGAMVKPAQDSGVLTTTASRMMAQLQGGSATPTWLWAALAVFAGLGTLGLAVIAFRTVGPSAPVETATPEPVPIATPAPAIVVPPVAPTPPVPAEPVVVAPPPEPEPTLATTTPSPTHATTDRSRATPPTRTAPPVHTPPPVAHVAPPPEPEPVEEPPPVTTGVRHRASDVSLDDF